MVKGMKKHMEFKNLQKVRKLLDFLSVIICNLCHFAIITSQGNI